MPKAPFICYSHISYFEHACPKLNFVLRLCTDVCTRDFLMTYELWRSYAEISRNLTHDQWSGGTAVLSVVQYVHYKEVKNH